jgi:hypothetical protein
MIENVYLSSGKLPFIVGWDRPRMTIWRRRIACWIPKATNTQFGCVKLVAFTLQKWLPVFLQFHIIVNIANL